ncbi:MAG: hypothetical protein HPY69_10825 [Armatimonadetes bacterium]|nr:hypothetical protein [Armatimonadota bacterium]
MATAVLLASAARAVSQSSPALVLDARGLSWDERCTAEALQGLVNREGPRLYLDNGESFEQRWLDIYAERAGLRYQRADGLRDVLERLAPKTNGLVVYDPAFDASRYVAITLAGVEGLIPVSPDVLEGRSPTLAANSDWPGVDFAASPPSAMSAWRQAANPHLNLVPGQGLQMREGNPGPDSPWSFISSGPLTVDLDTYPFLEADVIAVDGPGAGWQIKLTWDRDANGQVSGGEDDLCLAVEREPGVKRWNIRQLAAVAGRHTFARLQLHVLGPDATVIWRRVCFVTDNGESPPSTPPRPLAGPAFTVRRDLRGKFADTISAYEWALRELMPRCSRRLAHTVNGGQVDGINVGVCGPMSGFDWQTQNRGFVFNLGCTAEERVSYGTTCGGDPKQAAMYERILAALRTPAQINGYGDPEDVWCRLLSQYGHYSFHAYTNWSFHHKVPAPGAALRQRANFTPANTRPDLERFYVCFMTSEGDTMKGPIPFFYDSWFDPARGEVPVNWGINPLMAELFPAMLQYYYDTATPADYFFVGCSGAGYCYPDHMRDLGKFAAHTARACRAAGTPVIDTWGAARSDVQQRYIAATRPLGLTVNTAPARLKLMPDGTPVAYHELAYWQTHGLGGLPWTRVFATADGRRQGIQHLVERIESIATRHRPPFVILVYGDLHSYAEHATLYRDVARALDPSRFRPARLDEAMAGIRAWASERVVLGAESINERLAWAALSDVPTVIPVTLTNGRPRETPTRLQVRAADAVCEVTLNLRPHEVRQVRDLRLTVHSGEQRKARILLRAGGHTDRMTADFAVADCPTDASQAEFVTCWPAIGLSHPSGQAVRDNGALWGQAWAGPDPGGKAECIIYGPYAPMAPGRYLAAFRLKLAAEPPAGLSANDQLATLDVFAGGYSGTAKVAGQKEVRRRDFSGPGQWTWFGVEADWEGLPSLMETRVHWHGQASLLVDRVVVFRLPARALARPS